MIVDSPPGPSRYSRPTVCVAIRDSSGSRYGNRFSTRRLMPPPHGLFLGNLDRSSSRTVTPARASARAAVAPAGPAPTTITIRVQIVDCGLRIADIQTAELR